MEEQQVRRQCSLSSRGSYVSSKTRFDVAQLSECQSLLLRKLLRCEKLHELKPCLNITKIKSRSEVVEILTISIRIRGEL